MIPPPTDMPPAGGGGGGEGGGGGGGWGGGVVYNDDFDIKRAERATKHHYNTQTRKWDRTLIMVVVEPQPFAEGAMRKAFMMKDLSIKGEDSSYVLKMSKDPNEVTKTYFDDVQMQMEAKMYAELYNQVLPVLVLIYKYCCCYCQRKPHTAQPTQAHRLSRCSSSSIKTRARAHTHTHTQPAQCVCVCIREASL